MASRPKGYPPDPFRALGQANTDTTITEKYDAARHAEFLEGQMATTFVLVRYKSGQIFSVTPMTESVQTEYPGMT